MENNSDEFRMRSSCPRPQSPEFCCCQGNSLCVYVTSTAVLHIPPKIQQLYLFDKNSTEFSVTEENIFSPIFESLLVLYGNECMRCISLDHKILATNPMR